MVRLLSRTPAKIPHVILHPASAAASQNVACARGAVVATLPDDPVGRARLAILRSLPPAHTQRPDVAMAAAATTIGSAPPPANRRAADVAGWCAARQRGRAIPCLLLVRREWPKPSRWACGGFEDVTSNVGMEGEGGLCARASGTPVRRFGLSSVAESLHGALL